MYSKVSDLPDIIQRELLKFSYNKKDIEILVRETESLSVAGGDGVRGFAIIVDLFNQTTESFIGSWGGSNMFTSSVVDDNDKLYIIPDNFAVIKGVKGSMSYATITISSANVIKGLTGNTLSDTEKKLLSLVKSYTSQARKPYLDKYPKLVDKLVNEGYLNRNKAGSISITTSGKNACEGIKSF
jgi:hypothetical protein